MLGPPIRPKSKPLTARALSRTSSAGNRSRFCRASQVLPGSRSSSSGRAADDWRYVAEVTMRRMSFFWLQPSSTNVTASQSSSSGCEGSLPCVPKSLAVSTRPRPNSCCQTRFTATRGVNGFFGSTSHSASASRAGCDALSRGLRTARAPGLTSRPGAFQSPRNAICADCRSSRSVIV